MPRLTYWMDGKPGKRTLFLADDEENIVISFEEGARCLDLSGTEEHRCFECRQGLRYLHQAKAAVPQRAGARRCSFFHMEITDRRGVTHSLPGQMIVRADYPQTDGVDPILIDILNSIVIADS